MNIRWDLEKEYLMIESEYNKAKASAAAFRSEYKRKRDECVGCIVIAVLMILFYNGTITNMLENGPPLIGAMAEILRMIYLTIGAIYGLFLLKKLFDVYLEGYGHTARTIAKKMKRTPLTLREEQSDEEAAKYANRLNEIQNLMLDGEVIKKQHVLTSDKKA